MGASVPFLMPARSWQHVVSRDEAGVRLDSLLARHLAALEGQEISRAAIRRLIMAGAVRLEGVPVRRPGLTLTFGATVRAVVDTDRLAPRAPDARLEPAHVLFEDADLLAIAKPAGISTHATADRRRQDMVTLARDYLAGRHPDRPPYVGVHQRLDRETSGVLLFAIAERANPGLARAFAGREVVKVYHAITIAPRARIPDDWIVDAPLAPAGSGRSSRMTAHPRGQAARTDFRVLERWRDACLIEARPQTGRRHQVRAHLACRGLPILGDTRYGAPRERGGPTRILLHCARLELPHPLTGERLVIECPWPTDFEERAARARPVTAPPVDS
jgi:RluA family pseudouridine synthase